MLPRSSAAAGAQGIRLKSAASFARGHSSRVLLQSCRAGFDQRLFAPVPRTSRYRPASLTQLPVPVRQCLCPSVRQRVLSCSIWLCGISTFTPSSLMACAFSCQRFQAALVCLVPCPHPQLRLRSEKSVPERPLVRHWQPTESELAEKRVPVQGKYRLPIYSNRLICKLSTVTSPLAANKKSRSPFLPSAR